MSIIVLDADFGVTWAWNGFDHMDVSRPPVLGEIVQANSTGPTTAVPSLPAVDWLHINAVSLSPTDGNLVLSIRHQDWVVKIDYRNARDATSSGGSEGRRLHLNGAQPGRVVLAPAQRPLHRRRHPGTPRQR